MIGMIRVAATKIYRLKSLGFKAPDFWARVEDFDSIRMRIVFGYEFWETNC
jgi:hypothetical protein